MRRPSPAGTRDVAPTSPQTNDDSTATAYLLIPLVTRPSAELPPLQEALRAWVAVVTTSADACVVLDRAGRVAGISPPAAALVNEDPVALVGRRLVGEVFAVVDFSAAAQPIGERAVIPPTQVINANVLSRGLIRLRRADGSTVTVDAVAAPLHTPEGAILGSLTFLSPLPE
ncbi:MAG: PAS domain-containing protein [Acidothermus sp.]|nr:PAS domain-containing protein [Acidothermus sp.]MCL6537418.1 PAS domain-containing protein [Acidothermus sp.]